jgi:hypothetical protein
MVVRAGLRAGILDQIYEFALLVKDLSADPRIPSDPDEPLNFPGHLLNRSGHALQTPRPAPLRFAAIAIPRNRDQGASLRVRQLRRAVGIYP